MNLNILLNKEIDDIACNISTSINKQLKLGKNVLWFISGGSCIPLEIEISKKIIKFENEKLVVTLADERYGVIGHGDSNWQKLIEAGFCIPNAKLIPYLNGKNINETTLDLNKLLEYELNNAEYTIGLFGIGMDGHTAGILPHSFALNDNNFICSYKSDTFERITITPNTINLLNEAVIYSSDKAKWPMIERLKEEISIDEEPAQLLKKVALLIIFANK